MKIFISLVLITFSFVLAYNREQYLSSRLKSNLIFKDLANKLKDNSFTQIRPIFEVISDVLRSNGVVLTTNIEYKESLDLFKEYTQNAFGADEFTDYLLEYNNVTLSDIGEKNQKLLEISEKYYAEASLEYEKCRKTVYMLYPGIAAIIVLVMV